MLIAPAPKMRSTLISLALCAFAYLYVSPYFPRINNPNENVRLYMTAAIVREGHYEIDSLRKRWGLVNDTAVYEGHYYSVKAPGTSMLGLPAYSLMRWAHMEHNRTLLLYACRLSATVLPTLIFLFFFHRYLGRTTVDPVLREAVFFSAALGSSMYGYGLLFVSHTTSAVCAFGAWMLLTNNMERDVLDWHAFLSGLLAAGVTFFEYPGLPCSIALTAFALWRLRKRASSIGLFVLGGILPTLAVMHFQYSAFDNPFTPGHLYVEDEGFRAAHHQGIYGAVGISAQALYGLLLDPGAGLFPLTPLLLAALPGLVMLMIDRKQRLLALCCGSICVGTTLIIASMNNWRGGWTIGPRYLVVLIPFMAWLALIALQRSQHSHPRSTRIAAVAATTTALLMSGVVGAYYPHLPPALTRPLAQLIPVLIRDDFAPLNAANLFGIFGTASMIPLLLCMGAAALRMVGTAHRGRGTLLAGVPLGCLLCAVLCLGGTQKMYQVMGAVGVVTRSWSPAGYDRAARLAATLRKHPSHETRHALLKLYRSEGRRREAAKLAAILRKERNL